MNKNFYEDLVKDVMQDFEKRKNERRNYENKWRLNMNYVMGDQYCEITPSGNVEDFGKQYFWQEREVYNHIAPILETRLAKLGRVKCSVSVRPSTTDNDDINSAKFSTQILRSTCAENNLNELMTDANMWCEITGSCFYKVLWNKDLGKTIGMAGKNQIKEGDLQIIVCPPYEIFPEDLTVTNIEDQKSIIHAKAYSVSQVKEIWNVDVKGDNVNVFTFTNSSVIGGLGYSATVPKLTDTVKNDAVVVIEKYVAPTKKYPKGQLIIVAGEKLLYIGDLPYENGKNNSRTYPFIKQVSITQAGNFFGSCIVERCIPIQRAYNAIKNRKHEFLNRISMGVLAVEDGSIDTDNLEEEGLSPGKVLVYRQGSMPPKILDMAKVPNDFNYEEERLLNEFVMISGVSEIMKFSKMPQNVSSGIALNLLIEQDDTRISITADNLRYAVKTIGQHILRLYHQFAGVSRLKRIAGDNGEIEMASFSGSDLTSDDLIFDTENELTETKASRRSMVLELLKMGILTDDNGKISSRNKAKALEMLGFGNWENAKDIEQLHIKKAFKENKKLIKESFSAEDFDDHQIHIDEHTKFLLCEENIENQNHKLNLINHIATHKQYLLMDIDNVNKGE